MSRFHRLSLWQTVLLTQQHNHSHVPSCLKSSSASRTGKCRFGFPRKGGTITHIDENMFLVVGRAHNNEYIYNYSNVIALLLVTNHDVRFQLCGTTDAMYYVMKYVTNIPIETETTEKVIMASFDRRKWIEAEREGTWLRLSTVTKGRSRVNSMASAFSKKQQVGAPMCVLYLNRQSALSSSYKHAILLLVQSMAIFELNIMNRFFWPI